MFDTDNLSVARLRDVSFLGKLVGLACRHSLMVPLNLPSLVWKPLVGLPVDRKDLRAVDMGIDDMLRSVERLTPDQVAELDPTDLQNALHQSCVMKVGTDGLMHEEPLSPANRAEFIRQVEHRHLEVGLLF